MMNKVLLDMVSSKDITDASSDLVELNSINVIGDGKVCCEHDR